MKFDDILKLEREEQNKILENIHNKMDELGIDELVSRMKNLIKVCVPDSIWGKKELLEKVDFDFFEIYDETHTVMRFVTSWATREEDVDRLIELL